MIDYMIMEAVALKVAKEDEKARKDKERKRDMEETRKRLAKQYS